MLYLFDPLNVRTEETTFRVDSKRAQDLKSRALAAYFAPGELVFTPATKSPADGKPAHFYASADNVATLNRLDVVLGQDGWAEVYETLSPAPACAVRCTLRVRFSPEGDWVTRSAVGTGTTEKAAHREAFERAAVKYGVGRYLYDLPPFEAVYSAAADGPKDAPQMPQGCLPLAFRWCGPARVKELADVVQLCCESARVHPDRVRWVFGKLCTDVGHGGAPFDKMEDRAVQAMLRRCLDWRGKIERGVPHPPESPFHGLPYDPATAPGADHKPSLTDPKAPDKKPAPADDPKPSANPPAMPASGAELWARIEVTDRKLAEEKRITRDALKAYVIEKGVKRQYSADVTRWQGNMVSEAVGWVKEFLDALPKQAA